jgi:uncharacterized protein YraI
MWIKSLALAGLIAVCAFSAAEAESIAYTTSSTVLRSDPSSSAQVVATLPKDSELSIGHCTNGWCLAHFGTRSGYVSTSRLDFADSGDTAGTVVERTYVYPDYYPGPYAYGPPVFCCGYYHGYGHHYWRR